MNTKWDIRYLELAQHIASWSKDNVQVGCILVGPNNMLVSTGYNGPPQHVLDVWDTKEEKLARTIHAEANAILMADKPIHSAYITYLPCSNCMALLIQKGVKRIIVANDRISHKWNPAITFAMAEEAEVTIEVIHVPKFN